MKRILTIILIYGITNPIISQTIFEEPVNSGNIITLFKDKDLSNLLHPNHDKQFKPSYDGVIGSNYRRIQIHFSSIEKTNNPYVYLIQGKSKVGDNVFPFIGNITITHAVKMNKDIIDEEMAYEIGRVNGFIKGNYVFHETPKEKSRGIFKGEINLNWGLNEYGIIVSSFTDNYVASKHTITYKGIWESYNTGNKLTCCWSDYQIPCAPDDFNVSNGYDIIPNEKYSRNGWENVRTLYIESENSPEWKKAFEAEIKEWWR
ncbi:hypothetical protein CDL62_14840 [Alkalitalea saponilacus]|uniref:hypothetical protein n=1 Tax=Alkalitalea saponilacus TaxID=889453 RepID=UPI000B4B76D9|nr:hypothetical protein [Alkalitalea saponilacus]ASB50326.1 hypothetical protein CDL62_14840 [Alkalitalea saponilacus]